MGVKGACPDTQPYHQVVVFFKYNKIFVPEVESCRKLYMWSGMCQVCVVIGEMSKKTLLEIRKFGCYIL